MTKMVRKRLSDIKVTPAMIRRLKKLAERPDSEIDFSDIPEITEDFFKDAIKNPFYEKLMKESSPKAR